MTPAADHGCMAYTVPTTELPQLRIGDTWQWRREDLGDYPASTWTLTYYFRNATSYFNVTATADADAFEVSVAKATTAGYVTGWYDWFAMVDDGAERYQVDSGRVELLPDPSGSVALDARTHARTMLDTIEAALESRAAADTLDLISTQLDARGLTRDREGLLKLRTYYRAEVAREDRARNGVKSNRILAVG